MYFNKYRYPLWLILILLFSSFLFYLIFSTNLPGKIGFGNVTVKTLFANYDGPNYMIIAKCGYDKQCIRTTFSLPQPLEYYPAHLPGYPYLIRILSLFTITPVAMIIATLAGSIFLVLILFQFFQLFTTPQNAFWLSLVSLFLPARFFILRNVGAPETWFLATTIASIYYFKKNKFWPSAIFAALAQTFKSPAIILFFAYLLVFSMETLNTRHRERSAAISHFIPYLLVPLTVLAIFYLYYLQTGDFLAYFHSGDNFHLNLLPYQIFISTKSWIDTIWLEDVIYLYFISGLGILYLHNKFKFDIITVFPAIYYFVTLFVAHRDVSRYITPVYPFLILAFTPLLSTKKFKILFLILLPAIFLYATNFVIGNTAPVADWTPYL